MSWLVEAKAWYCCLDKRRLHRFWHCCGRGLTGDVVQMAVPPPPRLCPQGFPQRGFSGSYEPLRGGVKLLEPLQLCKIADSHHYFISMLKI
jgi:hypothetical protein